MRVALHVSGLIRREQDGFDMINEFILKPNKNHTIDIYLDVWNNKISKFENKGGEWRQERRSQINSNDNHDINKLYNMYKPFAMIVENDSESKYFEDLAPKVLNGREDKGTPYALLSQFYKLYSVNKLRNVREQALGIKYDLCVRTREELIYPNKIVFEDFDIDDNTVCVENENYPMNWISDKFAVAKPTMFDKYCHFYLNFFQINKILSSVSKEHATAEKYLAFYLHNVVKCNVIKHDTIGHLRRW